MYITSQTLCEIIVCSRYFNSYHEKASEAMKELSLRRSLGEVFPYEEIIAKEFEALPKLNLSQPLDLASIISSIKNEPITNR
jgi:hypothetical protein